MKLINLPIILIFIHGASHHQLYTSEDEVELINVHNFENVVKNSRTAWMVEFYANWCGFCQRFSKPWKSFAKEVASWRDMVRVGTVACSDKFNVPLCRRYGVKGYPTVMYFHEKFKLGNVPVEIEAESGEEVVHIKDDMISTFIKEVKKGRGTMYPNLLPYTHSDTAGLFTHVSKNVEFVFLIIGQSKKFLGSEIALDLHRTPKIAIKYSLQNNKRLASNLHIDSFPSLVVEDRKKNREILLKYAQTKQDLKNAIGKYLLERNIQLVEIIPPKIQDTLTNLNFTSHQDYHRHDHLSLRSQVKKMGDVIFQKDLETALSYSLEHEVASQTRITGETLTALNAYLHVIEKYFPFGGSIIRTHAFIKDLIHLSSTSTLVEGVKIQSLIDHAKSSGAFPSDEKFVGCLGSASRFRGYPCSLWRLFHFLTVNSYFFHNKSNENANPTEVLDAMHGYIKNYFTCKYCSQHFQKLALEKKIKSVATLEQSVLWLWDAHNNVNARLKGDYTEDPEYPKIQFPSKMHCPKCYDVSDGSWKKNEVLEYLVRMYRRENVKHFG